MDYITYEEKICQKFLIAVHDKEDLNGAIELINKYPIGGIVLFKRLYSNYEEMLIVINKFKDANKKNKFPLFIAIDQEGGRVNRFPKEISNIPSAFDIANMGKKQLELSGDIIGKMLCESGVNMNLGPILDLKKYDGKHVIGNRAFSSDFTKVYDYAKLVANKIKDNNVVPAFKHLPGQGTIKMNSHVFLPIILNYKSHTNKELQPFIKAINDDASAIMVGHVLIFGKSFYPTSLSKKFIESEIRSKYNYNNLIISDDYDMFSVKLFFRKNRIVTLSVNAGIDLMMFNYGKNIFKLIEKTFINKRLDKDKIDSSFDRIIDIKNKYNMNDNQVSGFDLDEINNNITLIK